MTDAVSLFLQAAVPGVTPYASGSHLWGNELAAFGKSRRLITLDLPGTGNSEPSHEVPTIDRMTSAVIHHLDTSGLKKIHILGHDVAGLVALAVAMQRPDLTSCISIVSSPWAAPSGDSVENYTLRHPPQPLWGEKSQRWAFDRLSYSYLHVDEPLIEQSTAMAGQEAHLRAVEAMKGDGYARTFMASVNKAKFKFFQLARGEGLSIPVQIIHGVNDPIVSSDYPLSLFKIVSRKQKQAQFHLINRCGVFPFREQPEEFYRLVSAFVSGLSAKPD